MARGTPRRRSPGRGGLVITVTAPDGGAPPARGLAAWLAKAAPPTARGAVTVALVSNGRMRALNRSFRGKDYATDVLSFPERRGGRVFQGPLRKNVPAAFLGDIVIAVGVATKQAAEAGHGVGTELRVLALHGLLHLLGYDHETDDGRMAREEGKLGKQAGLKHSLTSRRRS